MQPNPFFICSALFACCNRWCGCRWMFSIILWSLNRRVRLIDPAHCTWTQIHAKHINVWANEKYCVSFCRQWRKRSWVHLIYIKQMWRHWLLAQRFERNGRQNRFICSEHRLFALHSNNSIYCLVIMWIIESGSRQQLSDRKTRRLVRPLSSSSVAAAATMQSCSWPYNMPARRFIDANKFRAGTGNSAQH